MSKCMEAFCTPLRFQHVVQCGSLCKDMGPMPSALGVGRNPSRDLALHKTSTLKARETTHTHTHIYETRFARLMGSDVGLCQFSKGLKQRVI